ncbi:putative reverse transcriptase domain-containing protein [Tanacetum coccineum]
MERGFLSQKGSGGRRGVKEKDKVVDVVSPAMSNVPVVKEKQDTSVDIGTPNVKEGVSPSVGVMMVEKEKIYYLEDTTVLESFPTLTTPVTTMAGNAPGKSSYANITGKPSGKKVNVRSLFTPGGNGIDVKVAYPIVANYVRNTYGKYGLVRSMFSPSIGLFSFQFSSMDGLDSMLDNGQWFIRNNPLILKKWHPDENLLKEDVSIVLVWVELHGVPVTAFSEDGLSGMSSYARVMIELQADVELKDNIVVAMPKITREGHYTCNVHVEYEWKPPRCSSCKVFGHIHEECSKNTGATEKKNVKKPSQTSRGVPKGVEPTIEVSNSNLFDVLNSIDNDVEFGTNGGTTNW